MELSDFDDDSLTPDSVYSSISDSSLPKYRKGRKAIHRTRRKQQQESTVITRRPFTRRPFTPSPSLSLSPSSMSDSSVSSVRRSKPKRDVYDYKHFSSRVIPTIIHKNANRRINANNASKVLRTDLYSEILSYLPENGMEYRYKSVPIVKRLHPVTGQFVYLPNYIPFDPLIGYNWNTSSGKITFKKNGEINVPWEHDGFTYVKNKSSNNYELHTNHPSATQVVPKEETTIKTDTKKRYSKIKSRTLKDKK